ncbi:MAG: phytanoyl-CoA dioxygenase family protein [candidate division Zixibacteria bacterium]|nr:phytanoyl-CoA dioxygenase family protein [candidate division Zixibacteria bacterium]
MTEAELFEFDLNGVIVYRDLISPDDVRRMNAIIDEDLKRLGKEDTFSFGFIDLDPCFLELMAHPRTLSIMRQMIGDWMRYDHAYGLQMDTGTVERGLARPNLHGGPRTDHGEHQYQWFDGKMHNGLIVAIYALEDIHPGDGGFICVPGSHKANRYFLPPVDSHLVVNPSFRAGDMLIFTEALIHGTTTWMSKKNRRRALLYKYSPGHSTWASLDHLEALRAKATTDLQRDLLRPPCVGGKTPLNFPSA